MWAHCERNTDSERTGSNPNHGVATLILRALRLLTTVTVKFYYVLVGLNAVCSRRYVSTFREYFLLFLNIETTRHTERSIHMYQTPRTRMQKYSYHPRAHVIHDERGTNG
jgi:hypothetical protein